MQFVLMKVLFPLCTRMVSLFVCACVCATQRTLVRIPEHEKKKHHKYSQYSSPPICKTGTWSCTGEQSTLAVSHCSLKASVGLRVPTPAVRGTVGAPASSLPGSRRLRSTGTQYLLCVTLVAARHFAFALCV